MQIRYGDPFVSDSKYSSCLKNLRNPSVSSSFSPFPWVSRGFPAGVKLPGLLSVHGRLEPITVLECVLRQGPYNPTGQELS